MQGNISYREAFFRGNDCWNINDYAGARYWYEIAFNSPEYRDKSLARLIQLNFREGKYSEARSILNENLDNSSYYFKFLYGLLENIENNFEASKKWYSECMIDPQMQNKALLSLTKLYVQTADYEIAEKMFETLQYNQVFYIQATYGLICMYILTKEYDKAYNLLMSIDKNKLTSKLLIHYRSLYTNLLYFLGRLKNINDPDIVKYSAQLLLNNSDSLVLSHISKHLNQDQKMSSGCFFEDINLQKLLDDVKKQIAIMNPNHFELSDMYRFRLDTPIGFKGNEITNDICVTTSIGSKRIVTMFPVLLSNEFDKEGMSTSSELLLKRSRGEVI